MGQQLDAVVIPVGGGGLLAGMAITVKHLLPHVRVIVSLYLNVLLWSCIHPLGQAVESEMCPSFSAAMEAGKPVYVETQPSLADGLAVPKVFQELL